MKISNLIIELQKSLNQTSDPQTLMIAAKAIEKLKIDQINVINSFHQLPSLPMTSDGNVYLNENSEELYYNLGNDWLVFPAVMGNFAMSWGSNFNGQLGDGGVQTARSSPASVVGSINNWVQISAGETHALGVTGDGRAWSWGSNNYGEGGTNQINGSGSPISISGNITNWSQVSAGSSHSLGIANGVAWGWGANNGKVGDNTTISRSSPVTVVGGITNWSQVSAGVNHSIGIANGVAWAWGLNNLGQLGNNTAVSHSSPVSVIGGIANWSQVSAGGDHNLGITTSGVAWAWGENVNGKLGDNTAVDKSSPVSVVGGITNWSQVSAGGTHSLGIANGVAWAWGWNGDGRLGDSTVTTCSSPVSVVGGITNWSQVSAGWDHSIGLTASGVILTWGNNSYGQLGNGTTVSRTSPASLIGGGANWVQVSASKFMSPWALALTSDQVKA